MSGVVDIYGTTPRLGRRSMALADIDPKYVSQSGIWEASEVETSRGSIRIQHLTAVSTGPRPLSCSVTSGSAGPLNHNPRFPKLEECAHFHYDVLELQPLKISLRSEEPFKCAGSVNGDEIGEKYTFSIEVVSGGQCWAIRRTHANLCKLDEQLHRCVWDRSFSQLERVDESDNNSEEQHDECRELIERYLDRLSELPTNQITCGSVLSFFEIDNRGRHIVSSDDCAINTPAVAAVCAVRKYVAQAADELSFEVGDMISVIDMPPPEESIWWRGKRKFHVGFFPRDCVQIIGEKVPMGLPIVPSTRKLQRLSVSSTTSSVSSAAPDKPVLRKNGKLIAFFRSFILGRPSRRRLKQSGILRERVFSCDLAEHLLNTGTDIPVVLKCCSEFIETHGIVDGIYRLSGITSNIQKLRIAFDEDRIPNLEEDNAIKQDIHAVASLLKMYFRELPNPLCTYQLYEKFVAAAQASDETRLFRMREVAQELPPPHFRTLEYLLKHLARVAEQSGQTGMTPKNMAIVWAPNLIRCKELEAGGVAALKGIGVQAVVTEYLVRHADLIFSDKLTGGFPETTSVISNNSSSDRPKSLAISSPMRLMSLEEAQDKAKDDRKYIDVGGGPANLPPKYHTVIDIPGRRSSMKIKRSPMGWKHFFSRNRSFSKPPRKGPNPDITVVTKNTPPVVQQGLQPMWVGRLRPVKSVESLVSSPLYQSSSASGLGNTLEVDESELEEVEIHVTSQSSPVSPVTGVDVQISPNDPDDNSYDSRPLLNSKTHNRSISHDSYFEFGEFLKKNGVYIDETLEEENSQTESKASLDMSSEIESTETSPRKERSSGAFGDCESASMSSPRNMNRVSFGSPITPPATIPSLRLPNTVHTGAEIHSSSSDEFNKSPQPENEVSDIVLSKSPLLKPKPRYSLLRHMEVQTSRLKLSDVGVSTMEIRDTNNFKSECLNGKDNKVVSTEEIVAASHVNIFKEIGDKYELDHNSSVDDSSTDTTPGGDPYMATNIIYSPLVNESASSASSIEKLYVHKTNSKFPAPTSSLFVCPLYESGVKEKSIAEPVDTSFKCYKTRIRQYENLSTILDSFSGDESDQTNEQTENITTSEYDSERLYQNDEFQENQVSIVTLQGPISETEIQTKQDDREEQNFYENWHSGTNEDAEDIENNYEAVIYEDVGIQFDDHDDEDDDRHCYETIEVTSASKQCRVQENGELAKSIAALSDDEEEAAYEDVKFVNMNKKGTFLEQPSAVVPVIKHPNPEITSSEVEENVHKQSITIINSSSKESLLQTESCLLSPSSHDLDVSSPSFTDDMVTYLEIRSHNDNIKIRNNSIEEQEPIQIEKEIQSSFSSEESPSAEESPEIRHIDSPLVVDNPLYGLQLEELEYNGNYINNQKRFNSFEVNRKPLEKLVVRCNSAPLTDSCTDAARDFALELAIRTLNEVQDSNMIECENRTLPQSQSLNNNSCPTEDQQIQLFKRMSEPSLMSNSRSDEKQSSAPTWKVSDAKRLTHRKSSVKELLSKFEPKESLSPSPSPTHTGGHTPIIGFGSCLGPGLPRPDSRSNSTNLRQRNNSNASRFQHHRFSMGDILMTQSMSAAEEVNGSAGTMVRSDTFPELRTESTKENGTYSETGACPDNESEPSSVSEKNHHALRVAMSSVDMNDPSRRERIEKYKEERRIFLRQKISSEIIEPPRTLSFSSESKCSMDSLKSPDRSSFSSVESNCVFPPYTKISEDGKRYSSSESPRKRAFSEDVSAGSGCLNQIKSIKTESLSQKTSSVDECSNKVDDINVKEKVALWSTSEKKIYSHSTSSVTEIVTIKSKPGLKEATSLPIEDFGSDHKQPHQLLFRRDVIPASLEITKTKLISSSRNGGDTGTGKKIKDMAAFFERKQF